MMKTLWFLCMALAITSSTAFMPVVRTTSSSRKASSLSMALVMPPSPPAQTSILETATIQQQQQSVSPLNQGVENYLSSSTQTLSLQERHKPTAEEIAAKKRNFNLLFWGGGFVAPFLATFFYFGFKFWEK